MSFSNFNDALSSNNYCNPNEIGIDFETFKDVDSINYNLPLDTSFQDFNIQKPINDIETLNETNVSRTNTNTKLTHKECISIYNNPDAYAQGKMSCALKHVIKCEMCRNEIKNNKINRNGDSKSISSNRSSKIRDRVINDLDDLDIDDNSDYKIRTIDKINKLSNVNKSILKNNNIDTNNNKYGKYEYDEDIKGEINKKIKENFLIYQNAALKEKIEKTEKNNEEYLENNKKIDKLIKVMNYNISQSAKLNNLLTNYLEKNNEKDTTKETEIQINSLTSYNILIYCSIIIIILLVIDIIFRVVITNR